MDAIIAWQALWLRLPFLFLPVPMPPIAPAAPGTLGLDPSADPEDDPETDLPMAA
jgi:hypothetical protein